MRFRKIDLFELISEFIILYTSMNGLFSTTGKVFELIR